MKNKAKLGENITSKHESELKKIVKFFRALISNKKLLMVLLITSAINSINKICFKIRGILLFN